jgi:hypothetical protein
VFVNAPAFVVVAGTAPTIDGFVVRFHSPDDDDDDDDATTLNDDRDDGGASVCISKQ